MQFQKKNPKAVISTRFGDMEIRFYPEHAPKHVDNFVSLAKIGFYNGTTFHRVEKGFVIQGGDPLSKNPDRSLHGTGGPGYGLSPEPNDQPHRRGTVSMAKVPRDPNSSRDVTDSGSQFFICLVDNSSLDRTYTAFGKVVRGMDVLDKVARLACDERHNPHEPVPMTVTVIAE